MEDIWQNHGTGQNPYLLLPRENSLHLWVHPHQNICSWSGFKCIFGISKIPDSTSVIFIYPYVSRGLSDLPMQISQHCYLFLLLLQLIFFFSLNDLRQPTGCIFNFLCKAFCFSPRAVYLTVFSSFMHWYSYVIMYYSVTAEAWILRSSQPGGSLANNTQMAQKKSRCVLGGGLDKHCTHFFIGSFCAATSSERCQISSHWGKIVLFHGHDGFIIVVLWCLYSQSDFEHWFSAIKGEWFLTKTGEV